MSGMTLLLFILGLAALVVGAEWLVRGLRGWRRRWACRRW